MSEPIPMLIWCPMCCERHIDRGEFATKSHHTHSCQKCGLTWRPAVVPTVGVQYLPGFKDEEAKPTDSKFTIRIDNTDGSCMACRVQKTTGGIVSGHTCVTGGL